MSVLSSLLARDQVVPVKKIEEAIQRQVISGGELPTVLLEVGAAPENLITAYHAASLDLPAVSRDEVMNPDPAALRMLPRAVAERHRAVPVAVEDGRLRVAVAQAPSEAATAELAAAAKVEVDFCASTEPRIAAALHAHYQVMPVPRLRRLVTKIDALDAGPLPFVSETVPNRIARPVSKAPSARPAASGWNRGAAPAGSALARPAPIANRRGASAAAAPPVESPAAPESAAPTPPAKPEAKPANVRTAGVVAVGAVRAVGAPAAAKPAAASRYARPAGPGAAPDRPSVPPPDSVPQAAPSPEAQPAPTAPAPAASRPAVMASKAVVVAAPMIAVNRPDRAPGVAVNTAAPRAPSERPPAVATLDLPRDEAAPTASSAPPSEATSALAASPADAAPARSVSERPAASVRPDDPAPTAASVAPPSTLDLDSALKALAVASTRDEIVQAAFAHFRAQFDYAALFSVRDDEADAVEASGEGATAAELRDHSIDLTQPGVLHDVREYSAPRAGVIDATDADRAFTRLIGRASKQPAVVLPVSIRQRMVFLFYGDRGGRPLGLGDVGELMAFVPRVSEALQRIILERKRRGGSSLSKTGIEAIPGASESGAKRPAPIAESAPPAAAPFVEAAPRPQAFDLLGVPRKAPSPPDLSRPVHEVETPRPSIRPSMRPVVPSTYKASGIEEEVVLTRRKRSSRPAPHPTEPLPPIEVPKAPAPVSLPPEAREFEGQEDTPETGFTPVVSPPASSAPAWTADDDDEPAIEMSEPADGGEDSGATIITDMGLDLDDLVDALVAADRASVPSIVENLISFGEPAIRVLMRRFPGPLYAGSRPGPEGPHPRARDAGPLVHAVSAFGRVGLGFIITLLEHKDADMRYYGVICAMDVPSRELVSRIGRRILDDDAAVRTVAAAALTGLKKFDSEVADVLMHLRRVGGNDRAPLPLRRLSVELLGELRDGDCAKMLVHVLSDPDDQLAAEARRALVRIVKVDHGPGESGWAGWLAERGEAHRVEWLIDALVSDDESLRKEAGDELKTLTREFFGFQSALPRRDREVVQRKYRKWWDQIGRARFVTDKH